MERLLSAYVDMHDLGKLRTEKALIALKRNDFEPDVAFWSSAKAQHITPQTLKYPAPDWVCEIISPSTVRIDREVKLTDYAANGIPEYWIADPDKKLVEIYRLREHGAYELEIKTDTGILRCAAIGGMEFPIEAIFEPRANLAALQNILSQ
jgi:Uma2 family endonuclease